MRALSIRQPWAELILRGHKRIEYRSRPTRVIGERFWIYASKGGATKGGTAKGNRVWSTDLVAPGDAPPPAWMLELAAMLRLIEPGASLPTGVIVGSAVIERCLPVADVGLAAPAAPGSAAHLPRFFEWHLGGIERVRHPRKPTGHPQPVWFREAR